jgi:hypothetical protein
MKPAGGDRQRHAFFRSHNANGLLDTLPRLEVETHQPHVRGPLALLAYSSAHMADDGTLERHTLRVALWQNTPPGWRLRFHQGTPVPGF